MFARFDENQTMTLQDIKKTKRYGRTHRRTDNVKTVYPPQTKFAWGIIMGCAIKLETWCFLAIVGVQDKYFLRYCDAIGFL